jgi:hypothetical protein
MSGKGEKKKGVEERLRVKTVGAHIESGCQKRAKRDKHDQFVKTLPKLTKFYSRPTSSTPTPEERQKKESYPNIEGRKKTLFETLYSRIKSNRLESSFPNIEIALRIFLSMMVTNCKGERSFSKLKRIKNESRASTTEDRLNNLTLMSIESDLLNDIDFNDIISDFASRKSRSVPI